METSKELVSKKGKRPKSTTRYPKRLPTYVVAFSVPESRDDPAKNPLTLGKRSSERSITSAKSLSPSESMNSTKTFTVTPTAKLSRVLSISKISEVKIDILDDNQYGDVDKSPQLSSFIVVDNILTDEQPEVIFNAPQHRKSKEQNKFSRKKTKKNKRVIMFKNIHFKYKNSKNSISRRLEKYYEKFNSPSSVELPICLSKVVCKSRDLKKVLAKENLLDESDQILFYDGFGFNEYEDGSPASSPSTTKKSFVSHTSQNTLIQKNSLSSRDEDFFSIKSATSVIQVASEVTPYRTDVINVNVNVAVAVDYSSSKPDHRPGDCSNSNELFMHKENLTSDDTFLLPYVELTSGTPSNDTSKLLESDLDSIKPDTMKKSGASNETLTGFEKQKIEDVCSEENTFLIGRTSSDFNKSSFTSEFTISTNSDSTLHTDSQLGLISKDEFAVGIPNKTTLSDTVRNLGFYPEMAPSTSYDANFRSEANGVIVAENLMTNFAIKPKNKGDLPADEKNHLSKSVLRKNFDVEKVACLQRNIDLPNDVTIKANLKETNIVHQKNKCFEEMKNNKPKDISEMWERLTLVLDLAVKRLEETLADKILRELKKTLEVLKQPEQKPKLELQVTKIQPIKLKEVTEMSHKEVLVLEEFLKADIDESLQCDLVQNQVIDQLMLKLSVETPKAIPIPTPMQTSTASVRKLKKSQIVKDYFEVLKPPVGGSALVDVGKGDQLTVSTATGELHTEETRVLQRMQILFSGPMSFIKENMFVITSVPTFFIVLLCLYGIIVIIMKPW
ncbi:unnamed protein product [Chrysodeixis includens]|uniref:Uncharacterized protein n=1 Tax=Chrysodeixis includens TaxID=689277 RepID=A0A9P0FY71_CHRIL|nr:unnamed protein product [Chrysodeixis includens]